MKKLMLSLIIGSFLLAGTVSESYKIKGMFCQYSCVGKVESLISGLEGMEKCEVDFDKSLMNVQYDDQKINSDLIVSTISGNTSFETKKVEGKNKKEKKSFWSRLKGIFS
tara:strand:+ start:43 stop:372 length:330 start_codon:yes stop_codon:yes gene_type:complete